MIMHQPEPVSIKEEDPEAPELQTYIFKGKTYRYGSLFYPLEERPDIAR